MADVKSESGLTLTVLGCGNLGTAILSGILDSLDHIQSSKDQPQSSSGISDEDLPPRLPTKFNACVRTSEAAKRINSTLSRHKDSFQVYESNNLPAAEAADVIILGCKPYMVEGVLSAKGMKEALEGKLLLSICAGLPEEQIEGILYPQTSHEEIIKSGGCKVVRVMPNTAAAVRESMTVIASRTPPLPKDETTLVDWIFTRIGRIVHLPSAQMDASTALCGSGPAFMALILEGMADGGVAMGIPRKEAQIMAAQTMRGTTGLVLGGEHPAVLRDKVSTPGGCTIGGSLVLEEAGVRGSVSRAVREATVVASQLGMGKKNVNGTWGR